MTSWDTTWTLHVWSFHEAKRDSEVVKRRVTYIKRMIAKSEEITRYK